METSPARLSDLRLLIALAFEFQPEVIPYHGRHFQEDAHDFRIELLPRETGNLFPGCLQRLGRAILPLGGDGVERMSDGKDPGAQGNFLALEAPRISAAVIAF